MKLSTLKSWTAALLTVSCFSVFAGEYKIDLGHSYLMFAVKHMGAGMNYGRFNEFEGSINYDKANPSAMSMNVTVKAESIDTGMERRDGHLRSPDFFNAKQFATVTFKSTKTEVKGDVMMVTGDFTMLGVTKTVTFNMTHTGEGKTRDGGALHGFQGTAKIKRSDYGMNYGIDNGALADEVELIVSVEVKG